MKKILQTMYLRVDSSSKSLTKRALAQLILKIIYSLDSFPTKDEIVKELSGILETTVSNNKIADAFKLLLNENKISESRGRYSIDQNKKNKIETAYNEFLNRQNRIIDKFFNDVSSKLNFVLQWFEDVTIEFFKEYSSEWISDLCLTTSGAVKGKHQGIQAILHKVTNNNKDLVEKDKDWLKKQYFEFIQSNDTDVAAILWDYGTSCFSSSLITANTSADPISVDEFKDSKCILDTNILMYLDLEGSNLKESFKSMENIFIDLNITPVYFFITRDEFVNSMGYKKDTVLRVVENYPEDVIAKTNDPFIKTALQRRCITREDYERFFEQLMDIPKYLSELLEIEQYDSVELDAAIEKGQKDAELKERIKEIYKSKRHRDKRKNPLKHDAGLISGAEFLRKKEKCFILSRDISINEVALEKPLRKEMPIAIGLYTLINVLAIDNGGTDVDPTNYAPLFASIIKLALIPEHDVFIVADLSRMLDVQSQIADLPSDKIIDIAKELHHNQVIGVPEEEISLQLTRRFQSAKLELQSDLDKSRKQIFFEKTEKEKFIKRSDKATQRLHEQYAGELRDKYDGIRLKNRILIFGVFPLITIVITGVIIYFKSDSQSSIWVEQFTGLGINIIAWLLTDFLFLNKKIRSKYSERINGINEEVEKRIRETVGE
ncbi:MAG: hypothetical protein WA240_09025 [Nitrospirota bacterium]